MNYVIFDLEWNQAADASSTVKEPVYLEGEIIEIGAVKLDDSFSLIDELRLFIKPRYYTKMHKRIAALTGIRDRDLQERGVPFPEAYRQFAAWCGDDYAFMTWSMSDMPVLIDNMNLHGLDISDLPECIDLQRIFSREIMRSDTRYSLDAALSVLRETGEKAHDALHDAKNTAKVCNHLDLDRYIDEYTSKVFAERPHITVYESERDMLHDPTLSEFQCPWCGEWVKCEPWISLRGSTHLAYGRCSEEDEFLLQLSVVHHTREEHYAKRILFEVSDDLWDIYMDKKEPLHN